MRGFHQVRTRVRPLAVPRRLREMRTRGGKSQKKITNVLNGSPLTQYYISFLSRLYYAEHAKERRRVCTYDVRLFSNY